MVGAAVGSGTKVVAEEVDKIAGTVGLVGPGSGAVGPGSDAGSVATLDAGAMAVFSAAFVTELIFASAGHVIAALVLLDPELAVGALLHLHPFDQLFELLIQIPNIPLLPALLARNSLMPVRLALKTELHLAF